MQKWPSDEVMRAFYKAVEPALVRIAKEIKESEGKDERSAGSETDNRQD
jgi:hypothetical protein